jgi:hypothetical protein
MTRPHDQIWATTQAIETFSELSNAEEPLGAALDRILHGTTTTNARAAATTITMLVGDNPGTVAWTDERYLELDTCQYTSGRGPYLSVSVQLHVADLDDPLVGSLNVYSTNAPGFDAFDEALTQLFAAAFASARELLDAATPPPD